MEHLRNQYFGGGMSNDVAYYRTMFCEVRKSKEMIKTGMVKQEKVMDKE